MMGRAVKIRDDYLNDATVLRRLRDAIKQDNRRPKKWREDTAEILEQAIAKLIQAPDPKPDGSK